MTMHLCHPSISMTGKKKGKQKFRSAAEAKQYRELKNSWQQKEQEWLEMSKVSSKKSQQVTTKSSPVVAQTTVRDSPKINSLNSWVTGPVSSKPPQYYSGDKMIGISQMAKSNAVPVFNKESVIDISKMRRG